MRTTTNDVTIDGVALKKGSNVIINVTLMNKRLDCFPNKMKFDIDNFGKDPPKEFTPFGTGKKGCVGQHLAKIEMKVIAITLLQHLKFKLHTNVTLESLETHWDVAQQPVHAVYFTSSPVINRIFICGAHSVGKSTLVQAFLHKHTQWKVIQEIGRGLLQDMNITRDDLEKSEVREQFQRKILQKQDEQEALLENNYISDRGIDGFVYTKLHCSESVFQEMSLSEVGKRSIVRYKSKDSLVCVVNPHKACLVDDGQRMVPIMGELMRFTETLCGILDFWEIPYITIDEFGLTSPEERLSALEEKLFK